MAMTTCGTNNTVLHPESRAVVELLQKSGGKHYYDVSSVEEARKMSSSRISFFCGEYDFSGIVRDMNVPSSDVKDGIPIRVYQSSVARADPAIMIYYHGGGQVVGSIQGYDILCRNLADRCECIVVSVEYRLCPEHPLPAGLEDGDNAARWVLQNKTKIGGTEKSAVGVAGDSAGGHVASLTCHYVQGLDFQILVYPHVDERVSFASYKEYANVPVLPMKLIEWFQSHHHPDQTFLKSNPRFSANQQPKFDHLPPAIFIVSECDALRDDSYEYSKKLTAAGVYNELVLMEGVLHAFFHAPKVYKECCDKAYDKIASFVRRIVYKD